MINECIFEWAQIQPLKIALIHNDVSVDYITLARTIEAYRQFLKRSDLVPETIAVVPVKNLADAWPLVLALRSLGLTTICPPTIAQVQKLGVNVSCFVTTARDEEALRALATYPVMGLKVIVAPEPDLNTALLSNLSVPLASNPPFGGHILCTSGTTGNFKNVIWDSNREKARLSARSRAHGFNKTTVAYTWQFKPYTSAGWKVPLSVWESGGCVVFDQRADWHERIFDQAITVAFLNPSPFRKMVDTNNHKPNDCQILVTSGLVGSKSIAKAIAKFGDRLSNYYGSTELITPPLISRIRSCDDALWLEPTTDRIVQIVDDSGHECSAGQEGDLRILRTELDWHCYHDDEEATLKVFRDGFFYPGDRALRRADGRIRILGRASDVLIIKGNKIAVGPVEQAIQQQLGGKEVCVFSGLNPAGEDELVIAIESGSELPNEKLVSISRRFAHDKVRFSFSREFPRTEGTGKVRRAELRSMLFSGSGALVDNK
jgi:acyl-CoA synthetase (AMP-forming)/AMP-acid ligase II